VLVGAWTHVLWDAFTHKQGWFVLHSLVLQTQVGSLMGHKVCVFHFLWYLSSFIGVGWLFLVFDRWTERTQGSVQGTCAGIRLGRALMIATLTLVFGAVHHLAPHRLLFYCASFVSVLMILGVALKLAVLHESPSKRRLP
jgi:hypothetical protein